MRFFRFVLWATVMVALFSCSRRYHCLKCLAGADVKRDTVVLDTTIYIPVAQIDTVVQYDLSTDTLIIEKERIKIKFRDLPGPTVYLAAECPPDSVVIEKKVPFVTEVEVGVSTWKVIALVIAALVIGGGLVKLFG